MYKKNIVYIYQISICRTARYNSGLHRESVVGDLKKQKRNTSDLHRAGWDPPITSKPTDELNCFAGLPVKNPRNRSAINTYIYIYISFTSTFQIIGAIT